MYVPTLQGERKHDADEVTAKLHFRKTAFLKPHFSKIMPTHTALRTL